LVTLRFRRGGLASVEVYLTCGYGYDVRCEIGARLEPVFVGDLRASDCLLAAPGGPPNPR
jgi:hypothetical protein